MDSMSNNWGSMDGMSNNWCGMGNNWGMDSMSNNWGSMDGMSNNWCGVGNNWGMDSMGNNWGSMDGMSNNWCGMGNNWSMVSRGSMGNWGSSVCGGSFIGDISNITIIVIGMIVDMLDSAIGKVDGVGAINDTSSIIVLSLLESSTRVVISNSVGVGVWGNFSKVISNISGLHWGMVSRGSMSNNWGMISGGSMSNNWGSMDGTVSNNWGSMGNNWGMDSVNSMGDNSISTNSSVGSESLALCCASVSSLVWFANRLMADL